MIWKLNVVILKMHISQHHRGKYYIHGQAQSLDPTKKKPFIITKALYGLKSSGASFRAHLAKHLEEELGFKSTEADPDVWLRPAVKPDGEEYYEYVLCYVDDILAISYDPDRIMKQISEEFDF